MPIAEFLSSEAIVPSLRCSGKKQLLQEIASRIAPLAGLHERVVFEALLQRERLGSTGIGNGIAIPHAKFTGLSHLVSLFVRTEKPVEFEALDNAPVDIVFVLLAPEGAGADHLKALARIARLLRDPVRVARLRNTANADALFAILSETHVSQAA